LGESPLIIRLLASHAGKPCMAGMSCSGLRALQTGKVPAKAKPRVEDGSFTAMNMIANYTTAPVGRDAEILAGILIGEANLSALNKERIARLPVATAEQLARECELAKAVDVGSKKSLVNTLYRLTAEQKDQLNAARKEHSEYADSEAGRAQAGEVLAKAKLTAFKVKTTKNGYAFNLRGTF